MSEDLSSFSKRGNLDSEDYYIGEEGYIVFTEKYHLKRGYKHCPYGYDKNTHSIKGRNTQ
jgi:hypothetical protein